MKIKDALKNREIFMVMLLLALSGLITIIAPNFLTIDNISNIMMNKIIMAIMAIGMTLVIITSGIDISVGSQLGFSAIFVGLMAASKSGNMFTIIFIGIIAGILLGLLNGFITSFGDIPPIVVTLGTLSIYRGSILLYTNGKWVTDLPRWYTALYNTKFLGLAIPVYFLIIVFLVTFYIIKYTPLGRSIYAYGGNKIAANRVGINATKLNLFVFGYMGLLTGIASILYGSQLGVVEPNAGTNFEMDIIAAVVIGGTNILGGSGTLFGTLIGVMLLGVLQNGMILMHIETYWQDVVTGIIILTTVSIDVLKNRKKAEQSSKIEVASEKEEPTHMGIVKENRKLKSLEV